MSRYGQLTGVGTATLWKPIQPAKYDYAITLAGGAISIPVVSGQEPCWLHRKLQELVFGFKWKRLK